jgi:hypothetical protein
MKHEAFEQFQDLDDIWEDTSEDFYSTRVHHMAMHENVKLPYLAEGASAAFWQEFICALRASAISHHRTGR